MVKAKKTTTTCTENQRKSPRLALKAPTQTVEKKKAVVKKPKGKKVKTAENGSSKPEEPKTETTEAK